MTQDLGNRKYKIIEEIIKIEDESVLSALEKQLEANKLNTLLWNKIMIPMRKTISIEEMIQEQNYKPITANEFFQLTDELAIEEPLEDLLAQLN